MTTSTTMAYRLRPRWVERTRCLTEDRPGDLTRLRRVLAAARSSEVLVLDGTSRVDKLATALLARTRRGPEVLVVDCSWKLGPGLPVALATRAGVRAMAGPRTTFVALTREGRDQFHRVHRVDGDRVVNVPWHHGLTPDDVAAGTSGSAGSAGGEGVAHSESSEGGADGEREIRHDGPVFSGGRTARDYRPLLGCAADLPAGTEVVIATIPGGLPADVPVPANVHVRTEVDPAAFRRDLRRACVVVVALEHRDDCAPGIMVLLDAMALGKLTVVTDTLGVREHVEQGVTGFVVPAGDVVALGETLRWCLDPAHAAEVAAVRQAARATARSAYSPEGHVQALLQQVDRALERARARRGQSSRAVPNTSS
ncbi:glycosyltransferase [Arsenicicoccus cauae]|uniref:glycosyltransferase n=1 Tax=Arsenicicoccus cauae TaxID=2663847 RepID=UPI00370DDF3E